MKSPASFERPRRLPWAGRLLLAIAACIAAPAFAHGYVPQGHCGEFDRVDITSPAGTCVALVADDAQGLRMPRRILEVAPGRFWITDMGSWEPHQGRLLEMTLPPAPAGGPRRGALRVLADRLDRPHGLALGPDGKVYVAEAGSLWRTPLPPPGQPLQRETVLEHLPDTGRHPVKELAFGPAGRLYVNVGSATDACRKGEQAPPLPCAEGAGDAPRAAVYEAVLGGPGFTVQSFKPFALGLRNSLALVVLPDSLGGALLQGENGIDYPDAAQPPEELNRLQQGRHYGWPYCVGDRRPARGYEGRYDCRQTEAPLQLWPAHAAPLDMVVGPSGSLYAEQLLLAWHGYRATGHRVMAITLDAQGLPAGAPRPLLSGWEAQPDRRPQGTPAGLTVDHLGRLWVVEDLNRTVLLVLPQGAAPSSPAARSAPASKPTQR